ncbi:hypothetical protein [Mesorhizobium sp.]|uniref:hypothetical protein n=1 Tax=Mesorhizobium sp. TaxID=1871066 RepID=UPI00121CDDA0|nr:hypothetical protein [Mesorhizobium sp.]TIS60031.1 MAG: hypothetical protein E5W91_00215 [Mesorhizobium sp.]TIS89570.1 MAG: hypothetical protein E5W89_16125 [Mesorhizobium sp.]
MTNLTRLTLPALAFALCSTALFAGGIARAEDAMKPADAMGTEAMKPANAMATDAMSTNAMKPVAPTDAMKPTSAMATDAMKPADAMGATDAMAPAK